MRSRSSGARQVSSQFLGRYILVVVLYASALAHGGCHVGGRLPDVDVRYGRFLGEAGELRALRHLVSHLECLLPHVGHYHEEEKHGEYQVWQ